MLTSLCVAQAKHRRIRRWDILWKVYDLAAQWRALARRQEARQAAYAEAMDRPEASEDDRVAMDGLIELLTAADSPEVGSLEGNVTWLWCTPPVMINSVLCHRSLISYTIALFMTRSNPHFVPTWISSIWAYAGKG